MPTPFFVSPEGEPLLWDRPKSSTVDDVEPSLDKLAEEAARKDSTNKKAEQ
jgi:hypothetical protein